MYVCMYVCMLPFEMCHLYIFMSPRPYERLCCIVLQNGGNMTARIHAMLTSLLRGNIIGRIPSFERNKKETHEGAYAKC